MMKIRIRHPYNFMGLEFSSIFKNNIIKNKNKKYYESLFL